MYVYDQYDTAIVQARVDEFRDQVERRLSGALSEDQFKPLRLMNGLYLQLHAYMLRVAIPYGTLSSDQLRALAEIATEYDRGYGHITTRQNIQFNWISLVDAPDILQRLADAGMHAIQTSGNCIRNTTTDPFAGADGTEIEDPRVWCEIIRQWSTLHPEFSFLPRKFKIAVIASPQDRAAIQVHDIGLALYQNQSGESGFRVLVGGGLGRTPYIGECIKEFLAKEHLLSYLEAILRVYNVFGRRDNIYKARIKILVNEMGIEAFREAVEKEWTSLKDQHGTINLPEQERRRIAAYFSMPELPVRTDRDESLAAERQSDPAFAAWVDHNTHPHKQEGYLNTIISLKPQGKPPGDITDLQMRALADLVDRFGVGELRTSHEQNIIVPHIPKDHLYAFWQELDALGLGTSNAGLVSDIIACPGLDYCNLANTRSIPIANQLQERFAQKGKASLIGKLQIKISGCINACGHHHVGHIGILGVDKKGEEFYQLTLGGAADKQASLGEIIGRGLSADKVIDAVEAVVDLYLRLRNSAQEEFIETYRRVGVEPFREALYEEA